MVGAALLSSFPLSRWGEGAMLWQFRGVGPPGTIVHRRHYESISAPPALPEPLLKSIWELCMTEPLLGTAEGSIAAGAVGAAEKIAKGKDAVVIGPGLTTDPSTAER